MTEDRYLKGKQASELLNVHPRTLYQWEAKNWIETKRTKSNIRLYNVDKYLREIKIKNNVKCYCDDNLDTLDNIKEKINVNYVRVSSQGQKDDLERQIEMIQKAYPENIIIKDIGSGINMNRRGLKKIIDLAIKGQIGNVVVAYKDRLTRFGFELIESIIKDYSNGQIIILNNKDEMEPEEELIMDVMQVMNVFIAKMNGLRKYKNIKKR
jgi:putative resolvase